MSNKVVFVLLDGLQKFYAQEHLGYLEHLCEHKQAVKYEVHGELPSASRPMYETIFTGLPVYEHGITNNQIIRKSNKLHLFDLLKQNEKKSLVLGYYWLSELYISSPFQKDKHMLHEDKNSCIEKGFFYYEDHFPDNHLYALAANFMENDKYDFVVIHPMNIDDAGHRFYAGSKEYAMAVMKNDNLLSTYIPKWIEDGYTIVVASDHGMQELGYHGGNSDLQRDTMLYIVNSKIELDRHMLTTLDIAPILCKLLNIDVKQGRKNL